MFHVTGPWKVIADLPGGSYRIQHCFDLTCIDKKHASHPLELANFEPIDGPDDPLSTNHRLK